MIAKRVGKKKASSITRRCVIEEETKELGKKPLCHPSCSNRSTRQSIGIHELARDLPSSYSNKVSRNHVLSSFSNLAIRPIVSTKASLASFDKFPQLPKFQNTFYTLKRCGLCLGTNLLFVENSGFIFRTKHIAEAINMDLFHS